jgi:hypothetical protein
MHYRQHVDIILRLARELRHHAAEQLGPLRIVALADPDMRLGVVLALHPTPGTGTPRVLSILWRLWLPRRRRWTGPEPVWPPKIPKTLNGKPCILLPCSRPQRPSRVVPGGGRKLVGVPIRVEVPRPELAFLLLPDGGTIEVEMGPARTITLRDLLLHLPSQPESPKASWPGGRLTVPAWLLDGVTQCTVQSLMGVSRVGEPKPTEPPKPASPPARG